MRPVQEEVWIYLGDETYLEGPMQGCINMAKRLQTFYLKVFFIYLHLNRQMFSVIKFYHRLRKVFSFKLFRLKLDISFDKAAILIWALSMKFCIRGY